MTNYVIKSNPEPEDVQPDAVFCVETMSGEFHSHRGFIVVESVDHQNEEIVFTSVTGLRQTETTFEMETFIESYAYLPNVDRSETGL